MVIKTLVWLFEKDPIGFTVTEEREENYTTTNYIDLQYISNLVPGSKNCTNTLGLTSLSNVWQNVAFGGTTFLWYFHGTDTLTFSLFNRKCL